MSKKRKTLTVQDIIDVKKQLDEMPVPKIDQTKFNSFISYYFIRSTETRKEPSKN